MRLLIFTISKWYAGISDTPLNMALLKEKHRNEIEEDIKRLNENK
jgi:hypothetical protein